MSYAQAKSHKALLIEGLNSYQNATSFVHIAYLDTMAKQAGRSSYTGIYSRQYTVAISLQHYSSQYTFRIHSVLCQVVAGLEYQRAFPQIRVGVLVNKAAHARSKSVASVHLQEPPSLASRLTVLVHYPRHIIVTLPKQETWGPTALQRSPFQIPECVSPLDICLLGQE
ncbi:hypothetical protein K431DRAFT_295789 [Polychaeton citri CBS 116435]|uniref:Uncharacterized protein n=1 Tax=Polychaeton citri CBS 116435 TaxID=1314669 RepID=A0A9P4UMN6_9PEZI|nr:hypothetical protein K431DRAFT_295789 [Polychaeton citri CBS 116435]